MSEIPAGWYDNPEHPAELRYWDGTAWTTHTAPREDNAAPTAALETSGLSAGSTFSAGSAHYSNLNPEDSRGSVPETAQERKRRGVPLWGTLSAAAACLVLGIGIGSAGVDTVQAATVDRLTEELATSERATSDAEAAHESTRVEFTAEKKKLTAAAETAKDQQQAAEKKTQAADKRANEATTRAETAESALATQQAADQAAADQAAADQAAAEAAAAAPLPFAEAPAPAPANWSYKNCTEARNAGGAPVYAGQPGYGSHLDRDGDGVGCE